MRIKKSELKHLIKEIIIQEIGLSRTGQNLPPTRNIVYNDDGSLRLDLLSINHLIALRKKAERFLESEYEDIRKRAEEDIEIYTIELESRKDYIELEKRKHKGMGESHGLGYSHNSTSDYSDVPLARDPLNDPLLTGKIQENYRFDDFPEYSNMSGFGMPTDVYNNTVLLGVIESQPDGYVILTVKGPSDNDKRVRETPLNKFKTKLEAAEKLHELWSDERIKKK